MLHPLSPGPPFFPSAMAGIRMAGLPQSCVQSFHYSEVVSLLAGPLLLSSSANLSLERICFLPLLFVSWALSAAHANVAMVLACHMNFKDNK